MKKLFTLLCAVLIVFGVNAMPVTKSDLRRFEQGHKELTVKKLAGSKATKAQFKARPTKELVRKGVAPMVNRAPKARLEAVHINCSAIETESHESDIQYYLIEENNEYQFLFDIIYAEGLDDVEPGKTYTEEDMDLEYSGVWYDEEWKNLASATFTKTFDEEGLIHITGGCTDVNGAEFTFQYDEQPFILTGDTVRVVFEKTITKPSYSSFFEDWTIVAEDDNYSVKLDIFSDNAESPVGEYENDNFDSEYTYVEIFKDLDTVSVYMKKDAKAHIYEKDDTLKIDASFAGEDGVIYEISMFFLAPKALSTESIVSEELEITKESFLGLINYYQFTAFGENAAIQFNVMEENYLGTWSFGSDISGSILASDEEIYEIYSGEIIIASDDDAIVVTGTALAYNNVEYTLELKYIKPVASQEYNLDTQSGEVNVFSSAWQAFGYNEDESDFISIAAYAELKNGKFTTADLAADYTIVSLIRDADTLYYNMVDAEVEVTLSEGGETASARFSGFLIGQNAADKDDVIKFNFDFDAEIIDKSSSSDDDYKYEEDADYERNFAGYTVDETYLEQYGSVYIEAQDEENYYIILDMTLPDGATEIVPGVYPINNTYGPQTVYSGIFSATNGIVPSVAATLVEEGGEMYYDKLWYIVSGTVTVDNEANITVDAQNSLGRTVKAYLANVKEGVENTQVNSTAVKTLRDGQLVIEKNGVRFNALGTQVR